MPVIDRLVFPIALIAALVVGFTLTPGQVFAAPWVADVGTDALLTGTAADVGPLILRNAPREVVEPFLIGHRRLDEATILGDSTMWLRAGNDRFGFGVRSESQSEAVSTRPLIDVLQLFEEGVAPYLPAGKMEIAYSHTRFSALDIWWKRSLGTWDAWVTASLLAPQSMVRLSAQGMHYPRSTNSFLQFASYHSNRGVGYSLGGGIRYRGKRFRVEAGGTELVAGIFAQEARMYRGLVNSSREVYDKDGYIKRLPLITGKTAVEPHTFRPWPKWRVHVTFLSEEGRSPSWEAVARGGGMRYARMELRKWLNLNLAVSLGSAVPYGGVDVGVVYGQWKLGLFFGRGTGFSLLQEFTY